MSLYCEPATVRVVAWRYQRREGWGDFWRRSAGPVKPCFDVFDDWKIKPVVRVKMGRRVVGGPLTQGLIEAEVRRLEALRGRPLVQTGRSRFA